jgi:hypothetical protein
MAALEQHYTPGELGKMWHLSGDTIRVMFDRVPGILVVDRPEQMHKRGYKSMRIPASVAERVYKAYVSR